MDVQAEIKKVDDELIRLILAGEFEFLHRGLYVLTLKVKGLNIFFWMRSGASGLYTYHISDDNTLISFPEHYHITHWSKREELFDFLDKIEKHMQYDRILDKEKAEYEKLKKKFEGN